MIRRMMLRDFCRTPTDDPIIQFLLCNDGTRSAAMLAQKEISLRTNAKEMFDRGQVGCAKRSIEGIFAQPMRGVETFQKRFAVAGQEGVQFVDPASCFRG